MTQALAPGRPSAARPDGDAEREHVAGEARVTIRLFDADRTDTTLDLDEALGRKPGDRQLLWIDVEGEADAPEAEAIADRLELPDVRTVLERADTGPRVVIRGPSFHVRIATQPEGEASDGPHWLDLVAAGDVVLTHHSDPVDFLAKLDDRIEADAGVGELDAPAFVATALDAAVTTYFRAVDAIEEEVDRLDGRALRAPWGDDVLTDLVRVRRRIARLRRVLSSQREVFAAFATPDFGTVAGDNVEAFRGVASRFEAALAGVENSRDLLLGSFDVYMTRTSQRTNEVMKVLALATVLLLPGSLLAGLLGMNVVIPLPKDDPVSFWLVVAVLAVLAVAVLIGARARRWI